MRAPSKDGKDSDGPAQINGVESILSALAYASSSVAIILFNKVVLSTYKFKRPLFMTLVHMFVSLLFTVFLKFNKFVDFPDFQWPTFFKMLPLSICFVGNIVLGLLSTKVVSVPIMTTLRRLTAFVIIPLEFLVVGNMPTLSKTIPVLIMLFGAFVTGFGDLYFDPLGYAVVIFNDFATAGYLVFTNKAGNNDLGKFGTIFYNTLISCPLLLFLCLVFGDIKYVMNFEFLEDRYWQISFVCSALLAFLVNLTIVWCTQTNSALTTSVTGQTKNILTTLLGMVLFADFKPTILAIMGILISIFGSILFAYLKYQDKKPNDLQKSSSSSVTEMEDIQLGEKATFLNHRSDNSEASQRLVLQTES